jgi:hypothetical protein
MTNRSSPVTEAAPLTPRQKFAIRKMRGLERQYGRAFILKSLHQVHFYYQELERVAKGIDQ